MQAARSGSWPCCLAPIRCPSNCRGSRRRRSRTSRSRSTRPRPSISRSSRRTLSENVTVTGEAPIVDVSRSDVGDGAHDRADPGSAGGGAALDRYGDADARLVAGQHPRPVLSRQRQHRRRRHHLLFDRQRRRRREQHVGGAGRDAPELPDGRDRGIQGVDLFVQGRIRSRDRRRRQRRDEDRVRTICTSQAFSSTETPG